MNDTQRTSFFSNTISACESGWDFSSRWFVPDHINLQSLQTRNIVPIDLNSILYKVESNLAHFHKVLHSSPPVNYTERMTARKEAIEVLLWNEQKGKWLDYNIEKNEQSIEESIVNYIPLWSGAHHPLSVERKNHVLSSLMNSGLIQSGGVLTTLVNSTQQWDNPNAWSPLQWFLVQGMES
jgi:alpha,alpha-trehalase